MNELGNNIMNLIMAAVTLWIVNQYLSIFLEKKNKNIRNYILWSVYYLFQVMLETHKGNASMWFLLLNITFITLIAITGFEKARNKKILHIILLCVAWALIELLVYYLLKLLPVGEIEFGILGSVISKLTAILLVNILSTGSDAKKIEFVSNTYYLALLFIPVGSICIAYHIFVLGHAYGQRQMSMLSFGILLLINIMIFEIYRKLSESFSAQKENAIYEQQMELLTRYSEEQKRTMREYQEEKHNLTNQLVVLKENMEHDRKQEAVKDLDRLIQAPLGSMESISDSGNHTVDALINYKYTLAKEQGMEFKLHIFIPEELPIRQCDMGIILGNGLDNAMEAAGQCEDGEKTIHISMGLKKGALILVIRNPYSHRLKRDRAGKLMTTKKDFMKHGYGMNSIKKVVSKYKGEMITETGEGIFTLTAIMNI